MAVRAQASRGPIRQPVAGQPEQLARHDVAHDDVGPWQGLDRTRGPNLAAELAKLRGERICKPLGAAPRKRPADDVAEDDQREPETGAGPPLEREHRVGGVACKPRARPRLRERLLRERPCRGERGASRPRQPARPQAVAQPQHRAGRDRIGTDQDTLDVAPVLDERPDQLPVSVPVRAKTRGGRRQLFLQHHRASVVERVRRRRFRMDPLDVQVE